MATTEIIYLLQMQRVRLAIVPSKMLRTVHPLRSYGVRVLNSQRMQIRETVGLLGLRQPQRALVRDRPFESPHPQVDGPERLRNYDGNGSPQRHQAEYSRCVEFEPNNCDKQD